MLNVPTEDMLLPHIKPLKPFDQINLEFSANPNAEFKGNALICVGTAITTSTCHEFNRAHLFNLSLCAKFMTVSAYLTSNYGDFTIYNFAKQ